MQGRKLRHFARRTREATKRLLNTTDRQGGSRDPPQVDTQSLQSLEDDPAFHVHKLNTEQRSDKGMAAKMKINLQAVASGILDPKKGIRGKATRSTAGRLSKIERPYLSRDMDRDLLQAHDDLCRAQSMSPSARNTSEDAQDSCNHDYKEKVEQLKAQRESLRAAYISSRLVRRVRVVPKRHIDFPRNEYFVDRNSQEGAVRYKWLEWLGYLLLYYTQDFSAQYIDDFDQLPFDRSSLQQQIERLAMASAPWQAFLIDVRSVYRWENPLVSAKWLALYVCLWYTQHLLGFIYAYVIYLVLKNRYFPSSIKALRESIDRSRDQRGKAYNFGELVDKHGRRHWIEPLLDELGPFVQLQLHDAANLLEVFANFLAWTSPQKTTATLIFLATCLLITILTDMAFCMKITTFIAGGAFFLCWPVASRYPKYRYLVSPFKWALWDIPTDAEWSFQYLRRKAQMTRERLLERKVDRNFHHDQRAAYKGFLQTIPNIAIDDGGSDDDEDWHSVRSSTSVLGKTDIMAYRAWSQGAIGRLVIYAGGVRFVRSLKRKESWRYSFLDLAEMRKQEASLLSRLPTVSSHSLELKLIDGSVFTIEGLKDRDSAFNSIIGFSGLQWQALQTKSPANNIGHNIAYGPPGNPAWALGSA